MAHPLLLHGFTGSSESWGGLIDGLSAAGHPPVLVDLPGHGKNRGDTDPARFTLDSVLRGVESAGRWPEALVGYSMGGRVALHYALARPGHVSRLILESASPGLADAAERDARRRADAELASDLTTHGIAAFIDHWERQPLFETQRSLSRETIEAQRDRRLQNEPASLAAALLGLGTGVLPSLWHRLDEVECPVLLLVGARDRKFADLAARMAELLPAVEVIVVPGCGHAVHLERPDHWLEAVTTFLARD